MCGVAEICKNSTGRWDLLLLLLAATAAADQRLEWNAIALHASSLGHVYLRKRVEFCSGLLCLLLACYPRSCFCCYLFLDLFFSGGVFVRPNATSTEHKYLICLLLDEYQQHL